MLTVDTLRDYLDVKNPRWLLEEIERGERTDAIGSALAEGLAKVRKENEPACFTLPETWRFATRRAAARSRNATIAQHVAGSSVIDASCGIGLMLRELALLKPSKLIGFEIDPITAELARANARLFGFEADIETLDATSPKGEALINDADLVFCDPERPASASERTLDENVPAYEWLAERSKRLVYEVSPRISVDALPRDTIIEFYSERRRHARTTIYAGFGLSTRRVVSDRGEVLEGSPAPFRSMPLGAGEELELLDPTVEAAGLAHVLGRWHEANGKLLRIANEATSSPFIELFAILARGSHADLHEKAVELDEFGHIVLRYPIDEDRYWEEANRIRRSSSGSRTLHVFRTNGEYLLTEQVP